jgi:DNA-binding XRE family transcriptional regulator
MSDAQNWVHPMALYRERCGMRQEDLAKRSGVCVKTIGHIEGRPYHRVLPRTAHKLLTAFGLDWEERHRIFTRENLRRRTADGERPKSRTYNR